jgi:predicted AAA+ superfamily ATPase
MTGRFELLRMPHWSTKALCDTFALDPATAADVTLEMGTFPGAVGLLKDRQRWQAYIRDSIIEPSIGKDIIMLEHVRKPALLRQLFAIALSHPAEIIALHKLCAGLTEKGSIVTAAHYLNLLQEASLVASVPKFSPEIIRQRSAPPKLIVLNQAYLGATISESAPPLSEDPIRFGRWVENACLAHAWNAGQTVHYWREEPYEVDMIIDGAWGKLAVEIKTGQATVSDFRGLFVFMSRHPDFRPLVLCDRERIELLRASGVNAMAWQDFLLNGP